MNNVDPCSKKHFVGKIFGISTFCCGRAGVIPSDSAAHRQGCKASLSKWAHGPGGWMCGWCEVKSVCSQQDRHKFS